MTYAPAPEHSPGQPPTKAKKPFYKRVWFIVLALIVVIAIAANMGGGSDTDAATSASAAAAPAADDAAPAGDAAAPAADDAAVEESVAEEPAVEESSNPGIGQPAADGKFNFVVNGVDCSATELGTQYFGTKAQGQFCIVDVAITNIGDKAQSFFGDNAKLFNAQKQEFSADSEAAIYLEDSSSLYEEINPGNTLNSKVVFDVPAGTTPTAIELHDSMFSGGVTVNLQ